MSKYRDAPCSGCKSDRFCFALAFASQSSWPYLRFTTSKTHPGLCLIPVVHTYSHSTIKKSSTSSCAATDLDSVRYLGDEAYLLEICCSRSPVPNSFCHTCSWQRLMPRTSSPISIGRRKAHLGMRDVADGHSLRQPDVAAQSAADAYRRRKAYERVMIHVAK